MSEDRTPCGACAVILDDNGKALMIRRTGAHGEGTWSFPGGWVQHGEDPARAASRETWEEVGLHIGRSAFLGYTADRHPEGLFGITLWFVSHSWTGTVRNRNPERITDVRFWKVSDLYRGITPGPLFAPLAAALRQDMLGSLR